MIRALLFDCDGTLADNEPLHFRALNEALLTEGCSLNNEEYRKVIANRDLKQEAQERQCAEITAKLGEAVDSAWQDFQKKRDEADFIRKAGETYLLAIASGAWRDEVAPVLEHLKVADQFRVVVTVEDYSEGKPDPAPFLKAVEAINASSPAPDPPLKPGECIVFEDSIHGVTAARVAQLLALLRLS